MFTNTFKTTALLAGLAGLLMVGGSLIGGSSGLVIGFVLALVTVGGSYWFSDKLALAQARAQPVTEEQFPQYFAIVRELTQRADMPMPRLYITPDHQPNAFATGRSPSHAAVAVTRGIVDTLTWEELRGVLAHELAHVKNRDILIGSVAAAIATAITFAARMAMWGALLGGGRGDRDDDNMFGYLAMMIFGPIAAMLLQMAISRSREFQADASGASSSGRANLSHALEKLHSASLRIPSQVSEAQAQAYIVNPLAGRKVAFAKLFSTHPPVEERIRRLRQVVTA